MYLQTPRASHRVPRGNAPRDPKLFCIKHWGGIYFQGVKMTVMDVLVSININRPTFKANLEVIRVPKPILG